MKAETGSEAHQPDSSETGMMALAAVQVALDRRDNGGDAGAARDRA